MAKRVGTRRPRVSIRQLMSGGADGSTACTSTIRLGTSGTDMVESAGSTVAWPSEVSGCRRRLPIDPAEYAEHGAISSRQLAQRTVVPGEKRERRWMRRQIRQLAARLADRDGRVVPLERGRVRPLVGVRAVVALQIHPDATGERTVGIVEKLLPSRQDKQRLVRCRALPHVPH